MTKRRKQERLKKEKARLRQKKERLRQANEALSPALRMYAPQEYLDMRRNRGRRLHGGLALSLWGVYGLMSYLAQPATLSLLLGVLALIPGLVFLIRRAEDDPFQGEKNPRCWMDAASRLSLSRQKAKSAVLVCLILLLSLASLFLCHTAYQKGRSDFLFLMLLPLLFLSFSLCWFMAVLPGFDYLNRLLSQFSVQDMAQRKEEWRQQPPFSPPFPVFDRKWLSHPAQQPPSRAQGPSFLGLVYIYEKITGFLWHL